jgi:putative flippase GtrA
MLLFVLSIIAFALAVIGLMISAALWTFTDAKAKSEQAPALWLLIVLAGGPVGFIIYLAIGRKNKEIKAPGNYKSLLILFAAIFILATGFFISQVIDFTRNHSGLGSVRSGSFTMSYSYVRNDVWIFRARTANGWERRSPTLSAEQLNRFHVLSDSGDGIRLRLEQGNVMEIIDLSGFFDGQINMRAFEPGRVRITLEFDRARDVDVRISWRE